MVEIYKYRQAYTLIGCMSEMRERHQESFPGFLLMAVVPSIGFSHRLHPKMQPKMEKLYTVSKNKTKS